MLGLVKSGPILDNCASSTWKKVVIRPTKVMHLTYIGCSSDLQIQCIRPTKGLHPTFATRGNSKILLVALSTTYWHRQDLQFLHGRIKTIECTSDLQLSYVRSTVGRKSCRNKVTLPFRMLDQLLLWPNKDQIYWILRTSWTAQTPVQAKEKWLNHVYPVQSYLAIH